MGAFDSDILRMQYDEINKGLNKMDDQLDELHLKAQTSHDESKPLTEILREKREATEKILENTKLNQHESLEERRQRLRATRDNILKQKNEQRQTELEQFNTKATNKQDLFKELKEMDAKLKTKSKFEQQLHEIESTESGHSIDKRLSLYKNLRDQMLSGLKADQETEHRAKMEELNRKIEAIERSQRQKEAVERQAREQQEQQRGEKNKGFLDGIKTFQVEDI